MIGEAGTRASSPDHWPPADLNRTTATGHDGADLARTAVVGYGSSIIHEEVATK